MGTRADYYVGRGPTAEWLGSIAWDGDWPGDGVLEATTEADFRHAVATEFASREDGTTPTMGWPWPWNDSRTTDVAYAFDGGRVWKSEFGRAWHDPAARAAERREWTDEQYEEAYKAEAKLGDHEVTNMRDRKKVTYGPRSGVHILVVGRR